MVEHLAVDELLKQATFLAQKHRSFEVEVVHVVWAYAASATGEVAVALRVACRAANHPRALPSAEPPALKAGLAQSLSAVAPSGKVSPESLLELVQGCASASRLVQPLHAWITALEATTRGEVVVHDEPVVEPQPTVLWQRLELDSGHREGVAFVELICQENKVFERAGRTKKQKDENVKVEVRELKSPITAERSLERRKQTLAKNEYRLVGTVERPLPTTSSRQDRALERDAQLAARAQQLASFPERMVRFFEAWEARGYDPMCSFQQEGQRKREDWNVLAAACLELAGTEFNVYFTRRTEVDEEHGTLGFIGERNLATFYRSPVLVADIAYAKTRGELRNTDGSFPDWYAEKRRQEVGDGALEPAVASVVASWRLRTHSHDR
jgi:hypothetical protein